MSPVRPLICVVSEFIELLVSDPVYEAKLNAGWTRAKTEGETETRRKKLRNLGEEKPQTGADDGGRRVCQVRLRRVRAFFR